jgi:hypothetical protein
MKTINPPQRIWINGKEVLATIFQLQCNFDNLTNKANFYYCLYSDQLVKLVDGNLTMSDPDYTTDWFSNDAAYNWAAKELGLIITGNYQN